MGLTNEELKVQELLAKKAELTRQISIKNDTANTQVTDLDAQLDIIVAKFDTDKAAILSAVDTLAEQVALEKIEKKLTGKIGLDD